MIAIFTFKTIFFNIQTTYIETHNSYITLNTIQRATCFSIQVVAICPTGGVGISSEVKCIQLPTVNIKSDQTEVRSSSKVESLSVYPNPASNQVQITLTGVQGSISNITIFDSTGSVLLTRDVLLKTDEKIITWNVSDVQSGVYIVRSTNGSEVLTKKLIVSK